ncbi:OPT superfamily oligopeptide transporter, partial [Aureobasidium melanogenum]
MATKRPVFNHRPTDDIGIICDGSEHSAHNENNEFRLTEFPLKEESKDPKANANVASESVTEDENDSMPKGSTHVLDTAGDIVDQILDTEDDPTEKALTFRTWFLAITIMASAAAVSALATEALAAQALFYGGYPSKAAGIFIVLSSQLLGFGVAGMLRDILVYPSNMLWPMTLPVTTLLQTVHKDKAETKHRMRVWYIVFFAIFFWEILPEYMFTVLTGVSIFCLADQHNLVFTNLFGGASGNEGLGCLSFCFDWNYIASFQSPLW